MMNKENASMTKPKKFKSPKLFKIMNDVDSIKRECFKQTKEESNVTFDLRIPIFNDVIEVSVSYSKKRRSIKLSYIDEDLDRLFTGTSKCHTKDEFNFSKGLRLATARLVKEMIAYNRFLDLTAIRQLTKKTARYKDAMNALNKKYKLTKEFRAKETEATKDVE